MTGTDAIATLRKMEEADLPAVLAIERRAYPFPWSEGIFRDCLRAGYACHVAEVAGGIIGYGVVSIAAGESHVLNLCMHPDRRRQGHGATMLHFLMEEARKRGARCMLLEVRASNSSAIRLYRKFGFNETGMRRGYYPAQGGREDAVLFARDFL